jgi:flagellar FliL protein
MAATATADAVDTGDTGAGADLSRKRFAGKKLVLFILLPLLLIGGGVGGLMATGMIGGSGDHAAAEEAPKQEDPKSFAFFDLPDLLVNLNSNGKRPSFLKIRVSLELASQDDAASLQAVTPRILDHFQVYLRELRISDLQGSAGMARLREELLRRVNAAVEPVKVRDVLFREMLVQ